MTRLIGSSLGRRRRRTLFGAIGSFLLLALVLVPSAQAILAGSPSNFESNDGDMVFTGSNHDWNNVSFTKVTDTAASTGDNSFTPGQKQDTTCPTVEGHKNPPKDDFTAVASYSEVNTTTKDTYLYGATIRYAANGNASENVELKQSDVLCPGESAGGLTVRSAGDKLIAIDYLNGGTKVDFHVLTWIVDNSTEACFVGNDIAPCWGSTVLTLTAAGAEGLASQSPITAANNPITNQNLVAGQFAEFGVNLAAAGIIPSGQCKAFPQTVWESRASGSSFVSSTKDISIENRTISNCATVIIRKVTDPAGDTTTNFGYTTNVVTSPATTTSPFPLKDGESNTINNVVAASGYNVTETDPGPAYKLTSIDCDVAGHASTVPAANRSTSTTTRDVTFSIGAGETLDCTFTNAKQFGAIEILKKSTKTGNLVSTAGAVFSYDNGAGSSGSVTDDNTAAAPDEDADIGEVCVSGLVAGTTYTITETSPPPGYGAASGTQTAVATAGTNCGANPPTGTGVATFTNPPLADIQVNFRDGGSGETSLEEAISCTNATGTSDTTVATGWHDTLTVSGVQAGPATVTITCTIKIDP